MHPHLPWAECILSPLLPVLVALLPCVHVTSLGSFPSSAVPHRALSPCSTPRGALFLLAPSPAPQLPPDLSGVQEPCTVHPCSSQWLRGGDPGGGGPEDAVGPPEIAIVVLLVLLQARLGSQGDAQAMQAVRTARGNSFCVDCDAPSKEHRAGGREGWAGAARHHLLDHGGICAAGLLCPLLGEPVVRGGKGLAGLTPMPCWSWRSLLLCHWDAWEGLWGDGRGTG